MLRISGLHAIALKQAFEQGQEADTDDTNPFAFQMENGNGDLYCPMASQRDAWNLGRTNDFETMQRVIDDDATEADKAKFERIALKGHDCDDHSVHKFDGNDYYECGRCGELLQVG